MLSDVDHLSPPVALLGNGRPTVHGSLLEIGGSIPNGCKCGNVGSGSAEIAAANSATIPRPSSKDNDRSRWSPPLISDRPTTTATCSPPSTTSSKSSPSRLNRRQRVNLCERHKETVTCSSPQLPNNDDDSSIELYVCSHGGNGHIHNNHPHHHNQHQNNSNDRCRAAMSSNPQGGNSIVF